jgi:hypothetical protein
LPTVPASQTAFRDKQRPFSIIHSCYNITSQLPLADKENEMLQQITIETPNISQFEPILRTALEREVHLVEYAILRTQERLAEFEKKFGLSTSEFERRFHPGDLEVTLDFIEWWGEVKTLRLLDEKLAVVKAAHIK